MVNMLEAFTSGQQAGRQAREYKQATADRDALRGLAPQIISGDPAAFDQAAAIDPKAAQAYQGAGDSQLRRLKGAIDYFDQAVQSGDDRMIQARFREISPFLSKVTGKPAPPAWTPDMAPAFDQVKTKIAMASSGTPQGRVQSTYIDAQGNRVAIMADGSQQVLGPNAPNNQIIDTGDGFYGVNKGNLNAAPVRVGGQQQAPQAAPMPPTGAPGVQPTPQGAPTGRLDINSDLQQFASLGIPVSSTRRTPERNGQVGGVENSYHLTGEAVDVAATTPEQKSAAQQFWGSRGYQVIDEGDHLHVEPPARGMTASQIGGPQLQTTGAVTDGILRSAPKPPSASDQLAIETFNARQTRTLSPQEVEASGYREGTIVQEDGYGNQKVVQAPASARASMSEAERKDMLARRAKVPQLQNAIRGLDRIETALGALNTPGINTGPLDQYAVRAMPSGQELEAAVGGIQNAFLALTRVPGIGSQSDLEARIAALQYPSLDKAPEVNARTMQNLRAFAQDLAKAYQSAIEQDAAAPQAESAPAASNGVDDLLGKYGIR